MKRKIVNIDEERCNGCGACASACHEGAIRMIDGKARLIKDDYCDGLGDCLPACPTGAITIIEREAAEYDEEGVKAHLAKKKEKHHGSGHVCPGSMARSFKRNDDEKLSFEGVKPVGENKSRLMQWPVQIKLVPVNAPYFDGARLLIAADCAAYAHATFHNDFIHGHVVLIGCPKLDEGDYSEKLTEIIKNNNIKSVKAVRMEVPCCAGIENAVIIALQNSGKMIPWQTYTITTDGKLKED